MKKVDNKGFSLVELLIAVVILSIVVAPILHSFVSSYTVNARSKQTLRVTTLAQNEMEIFEKEKIEDLKDTSKFDYDEVINDTTTGTYVFAKKGVTNDDSGKALYDVYVTLDPQKSTFETDINSKELVQLDNMGPAGSARFIQPIRTKYKKNDLDESIYRTYAASSDRMGKYVSPNYFAKTLERKITLRIEKDASEVTKVKAIYQYECKDTSLVESGKTKMEKEFPIFDNSTLVDRKGNKVELQSVYFFYAPRYEANNDIIEVQNLSSLPITVNIVRLDVLQKDSATEPADVPKNYKPTLVIADHLKCGKYCTNLKINASAGGIEEGTKAVIKDERGKECKPEDLNLTNMGGKESKDRIYDMTVEVYKTGSTPGTDSPMITLTGTKLE